MKRNAFFLVEWDGAPAYHKINRQWLEIDKEGNNNKNSSLMIFYEYDEDKSKETKGEDWKYKPV